VPASLSGRRALEFVLRNTANVDKSLLFDVEILAVEGDGSVGLPPRAGRVGRGRRRETQLTRFELIAIPRRERSPASSLSSVTRAGVTSTRA
jgi:hypothetical protein